MKALLGAVDRDGVTGIDAEVLLVASSALRCGVITNPDVCIAPLSLSHG
jgi:hypothetical protein